MIDQDRDRDQGSFNDRKLLKIIFFSEYAYLFFQNKLKFHSSTDFKPMS